MARTSRRGTRWTSSRASGCNFSIVTPLQKVHVIEPYVGAIGFVDNPSGTFSRLQTMTIEEFRLRQREQGE